jgi:hypothetical protein
VSDTDALLTRVVDETEAEIPRANLDEFGGVEFLLIVLFLSCAKEEDCPRVNGGTLSSRSDESTTPPRSFGAPEESTWSHPAWAGVLESVSFVPVMST